MKKEHSLIDYQIIGSSSKGNSVRVGPFLFDCGLSYKFIADQLWDISFVMITHKHSDHFKKSTLDNIKRFHPLIQTVSNAQVAYNYDVDLIVTNDAPFELKDKQNQFWYVHPFRCHHGAIECTGYSVSSRCSFCKSYPLPKSFDDFQKFGTCTCKTSDSISFIYATDTNSLQDAPQYEYDFFFLESNYDESKIKHYIDCPKYGSYMIEGSLRHLSTQKCLEFFYNNRKPNSELIELHKSSRFY